MKKEELFNLIDNDLIPAGRAIMEGKGTSYSGLDDKLGNFKRVAANLNVNPELVWYVYYSKHADSLASFIRGEYKDTEGIKSRIIDMVNYLYLFAGILKEKGKLDETRT